VDKILDLSLSLKGANRGMDSGTGYQDGIYFDRTNPKTVRFDYHPNDLIADSTIQKLVSDPTVLKIAQDYLGTLPVLDFVVMWWHTKSKNPDKEAAQYFHFDMDRLRWVKFFFYITDVGPENGPHIFVPKSHSDNGLPFALRKNGYKRLDDNQVEIHFKQDSWQEFVGPKGSMIVEDTRGLHKGKHVQNGDRLVFQIQFTTSLFGTDISSMEISDNKIGKDLRKAMAEFPEIYKNIKHSRFAQFVPSHY
jgi:ectoine hydroxylase-related dioxygenase (phytanoyl-CoA dioxygenase family)